MLRPHGFSDADMRTMNAELSRTHWRRVEAEVTTLDGRTVAHMSPEVSEGNIVVDAEADDETPSRILDMTFYLSRRAVFEPESSADIPFHRKYALRVTDVRTLPSLGPVEIPVFYGPLWDFDSTGREARVVAHGWERQMYQAKWNQDTFPKGTRKTHVIKALLAEAGFTNLGGIPDLGARLPEKLTVTKDDLLWPVCKHLARSMNMHLFFDATGRPRLRRDPDAPCFIFDDRHLMAEPVVDRDASVTYNTFEVIGRKPKGAKQRVRDVRELADAFPGSKESLSLNGHVFRSVQSEQNDAIKTKAEAMRRAKSLRNRAERGMTDTQVDVLPFPHLEELDLVGVSGRVGAERIRVSRFSLPLSFDPAPLSINSLRHPSQRGRGRSGKQMGRRSA